MQYHDRKIIFAVSVIAILITSVSGQIIPASGALVKRDFSYLNDQHLTTRSGNTLVCGDHMCAPGEWDKLRENLNQAQIGHGAAKNFTKTMTIPAGKHNSTSSVSNISTPPTPTPIPTPPPVPYSVCKAVKATLTNSTISSDIITKIMIDLGCI